MPMKSIEVLSVLQQRSIDALKVAQSAQLCALRAARESAAPAMLPAASYVTDVAVSVTYGLLAQQAAFAKQVVSVFAPASKSPEKPTTVEATVPPASEPAAGTVVDTVSASPNSVIATAAPIIEGSLDSAADAIESPRGWSAEPAAEAAIGALTAEPYVEANAATAEAAAAAAATAEALNVTSTAITAHVELDSSPLAETVEDAATPVASLVELDASPIAQTVNAAVASAASDVAPGALARAEAIHETAIPFASLVELDASPMSETVDVSASPGPAITEANSAQAPIVAVPAAAADHDDSMPTQASASIESSADGLGLTATQTTLVSATDEDAADADASPSVVAPMYAESVSGEIAASVGGAPDESDLREIVVANAPLVDSPTEIVAKTIGAPKGGIDLPASSKPLPASKKKAPSVSGNGASPKRGAGNKPKRAR